MRHLPHLRRSVPHDDGEGQATGGGGEGGDSLWGPMPRPVLDQGHNGARHDIWGGGGGCGTETGYGWALVGAPPAGRHGAALLL